MNRSAKQALFWTPRILCILFAVFLSIFAFDVFGEDYGFWETALALFVHLAPVYVVAIVLVIAWRWEWLGAILFIVLGLLYLIWGWGRFPWGVYVVIAGPLFFLGILFLFNWKYREQLRAR